MGFEVLIGNLRYIGFYDFLLPFILFIAITYGLLDKSKAISEESSLNGVIAISVSFFIINYTPLGLYFTSLFGIASTILAAFLVLALFGGMFGIQTDKMFEGEHKVILPIALLLLALLVVLSTNITDFFDTNNSVITTIFLLFIMIIGVVMIGNSGGGGS